MGIRSLSSYITQSVPNTLQKHELRDTILIIDGNNLAYFLYLHCSGINVAFGGDYDKYSRFIQKFFEGLKECHVQSIVVMDGGQPLQGRKVVTLRQRMLTQISVSLGMKPSEQFNRKIFPPIGLQVFVTTLRSMGIPVLQTDFEADREIGILASKLGAKILSNDSDFFVCDVYNIRPEDLNYKNISQKVDPKTGQPYKFYSCRQFNKDQFCKISGIKREFLPALGPLLTNDYIELCYLNDFYRHLTTRRKGKVKHDLPDSHLRIKDVLKFLQESSKMSPEEIVRKVADDFVVSIRMKRIMMESLSEYKDLHTFETNLLGALPIDIIKATRIFSGEEEPQYKFIMDTDLRLKDGRQPPKWFIEAYRSVRIPHEVCDILTQGYFISSPHVEVARRRSASLVVQGIIQAVFTFLWKGMDWDADYEEVDIENDFEDYMSDSASITDAEDTVTEDKEMEVESNQRDGTEQTTQKKENGPQKLGKKGKKGQKRKKQVKEKLPSKKIKSFNPPFRQTEGKTRRRVRWFVRKAYELSVRSVPILPDEQAALLPSLHDVESLSPKEKKTAFYRMLNMESKFTKEDLPDDLELILNFITYWLKNCSAELRNIHAQTVLMCVFQYYIIDGKIGRVRTKKELKAAEKASERVQMLVKEEAYASCETVKDLLSSMSNDECLVATKNLFSFHHLADNFRDSDYNKDTVHSFCEYQVCVYFLQLVNSVLGFPFPQMSIEFLWGGTFSYNILQHLKRSHKPMDWIQNTLGAGTCLDRLFVHFYNLLYNKRKFKNHQATGKQKLKSMGLFEPKSREAAEMEDLLLPVKEKPKPTILSRLDERFEGLEIDF